MGDSYASSALHSLQQRTRQIRGFEELEAVLAGLTYASSQRSQRSQRSQGSEGDRKGGSTSSTRETAGSLVNSAVHTAVSTVSHLLPARAISRVKSLLGGDDGEIVAVTDKDCVWLLDNVAYRDAATGQWQAEYLVSVMEKNPSCPVVESVRIVADKLGLVVYETDSASAQASKQTALQTVQERLLPFLQAIRSDRQVHARHGRHWKLQFRPSDGDGLSSLTEPLPMTTKAGALVPTHAVVPEGADGMLQMLTLFAEGEGWGVISDVDDTIKRTQTSDPIGILQTTFVDEPTPIPGMPELYRSLHATLNSAPGTAPAPFFYLSASPYNLYPFLRGFRDEHFPHGPLLLRNDTAISVAGLLSMLSQRTQAYKVGRMRQIHDWLPAKSFICIGDSTQSDPEAYGEIYRTFPGWVKLILIRKVTDIAALGIEEKNEPARFEKAFEGVPRSVWHVFEEAQECYEPVKRTVGGQL